MTKPDYKHDMKYMSCRLNICKHPPKNKKRTNYQLGVRYQSSKSSSQRANSRATRESIKCIECESLDAKVGRFKTKCYDCGLEIEHD